MTLAIKIREARKALNMNQKQFSEKLGVSQSAISNWEKGKDKPSGALLILLSEVLDDRYFISREVLLGKATHTPIPKLKPIPLKPPSGRRQILDLLEGIDQKLEKLLYNHRKKGK